MDMKRAVRFAVERLEARVLLSGALPHAGVAGMAYDAGGVLHVAYYDSADTHLKYATRAADGTWSAAVTVDAGAGVGAELSLALDSAGRPGVAYYDAAHQDLKYAHFDGAAWSVRTIDGRNRVGRNPSLAYAAGDKPLISYYAASGRDLRLASFNRKWHVETIDAAGNVGRFSSLAIDPADGEWMIAYEAADAHEIRFAAQRRRTFSVAVIAAMGGASGWASKPSLAFDAGGVPAVSYANPAADDLMLARVHGKRWRASVAAGADVGTDNTLSFDAQSGRPRVVYADGSGGLNLASYDGTAWDSAALGTGSCAAAAEDSAAHVLSFLSGEDVVDVNPGLLAPTGVVAEISLDDPTWINVRWDDHGSAETGFQIERSFDGVAFTPIDVVPAGTTNFDDAGVVHDQTYYYRVTPFDGMGNGQTSAVASGTALLAGPTNLHAVVVDAGRVDLTWTNVSTTATKVNIYCLLSPDGFDILNVALDLPPGTTSYSVTQLADGTPLTADTAYAFWVSAARDSDAYYMDSPGATAVTGFAAPSDLFNDAATDTTAHLTWSDVLGEAGYELQGSADGVTYQTLATLGADVTEYSLGGLTEGSVYHYRVRALSGGGNSAYSVSAVNTLLSTPTNVVATALAGGQVQLNWDDVSGVETNYVVEVAGPSGAWTLPITLPAGTTSYVASDGPYGALVVGQQYRFSVRSLIFAGGASGRGVSGLVTVVA